ncbi:MAG: clostripain-related cysteine peptidase, partial [Chloroflexota bacterium]|nr:clostripain-related cysteine peptidase [Chloroflexota bacterium]
GIGLIIAPAEAVKLPSLSANTAPIQTEEGATNSIDSQEHETLKAEPTIATPQTEPAAWTFMVYLNADDYTLEEAAIGDFLEMASVGSDPNINIVVQLDRFSGYDSSYDNWTDCRRYFITEGLTPADGNEIMTIGEVNMGDPNTLVDFVAWTISNYPAENYALVISSHGKGWQGCCWDEASGSDNLELAELKSSLSYITEVTGRPIDLVGFDACLMGLTEVGYEIRNYASVMVASEHAEPSLGWPYDSILTDLSNNPVMDAGQLATTIVERYNDSYKPTGYTMSAIDLTHMDTLARSINDLAVAMSTYETIDVSAVGDLAQAVTDALDEAVIAELHGNTWAGSHGLAIYFPKTANEFELAYSSTDIAFAQDTNWDEFLISYYTDPEESWIADARLDAQQYYSKDHVDLYDFCERLK